MSPEWDTLCVDPGETTGWAIFDMHGKLVDGGQHPLWSFGDIVWWTAFGPHLPEWLNPVGEEDEWITKALQNVKVIVCEDFRIYPWEAKKGTMDWDQVRTARLIGSLTQTARIAGWEFILQPAAIKDAAERAGAKALYETPHYQQRHQNDAIQHGVYYFATQRGMKITEVNN